MSLHTGHGRNVKLQREQSGALEGKRKKKKVETQNDKYHKHEFSWK